MNGMLVVHLTNACNLKCPYCYIKQSPKYITLDIFKQQLDGAFRVLRYLQENDNVPYEKYSIAFFGGEPLLNKKAMYEIADYCQEKNLGADYHVQTNGVLLDTQTASELEAHGINFSISFDGLWQKAFKDKYDNNSYFSLIDNKIQNQKEFQHRPAKCMISPDVVDSMIENYNYFLSRGIKNPDFTLVRDNIWSFDNIKKYEENLIKLNDYLIELSIKNKDIYTIGMFSLYIANTMNGKRFKRNFSCFAGVNGCSLTPDGIIYPCSRFYNQQKFPLYDSNTDTMFYDNLDFFKQQYDITKFEKCKNCSLYQYCNAGCTFSQLEYGNFTKNQPIDSICALYKITYREALRYYKNLKDNKINIAEYINRIFF